MPFPHEAILGRAFTSALADAYPHHSWPSATRDGGNASPRAEEKALPPHAMFLIDHQPKTNCNLRTLKIEISF